MTDIDNIDKATNLYHLLVPYFSLCYPHIYFILLQRYTAFVFTQKKPNPLGTLWLTKK